MKKQGGGHIANVSSAAGFASLQWMAPYNTSKAAVISLSETLRSELAPFKIGVTAICPSFFDTNLLCTASFTDDWERDFAQTCFSNARMSAAQIAASAIKAIKKRKLYVIPQPQAKLFWFVKRSAPGLFHWNLAFYNRLGLARPLVLFLAKHGLI
jgi:short-subunit dehydrogenase